jgi:hypothetical protein
MKRILNDRKESLFHVQIDDASGLEEKYSIIRDGPEQSISGHAWSQPMRGVAVLSNHMLLLFLNRYVRPEKAAVFQFEGNAKSRRK